MPCSIFSVPCPPLQGPRVELESLFASSQSFKVCCKCNEPLWSCGQVWVSVIKICHPCCTDGTQTHNFRLQTSDFPACLRPLFEYRASLGLALLGWKRNQWRLMTTWTTQTGTASSTSTPSTQATWHATSTMPVVRAQIC